MYEALFQPLQVRNKVLRNRVVMPPMVTNMGLVTEQAVAWYAERAKGGVGLVIVESTPLERLQDKAVRDGLPRLAERCTRLARLLPSSCFSAQQLMENPCL